MYLKEMFIKTPSWRARPFPDPEGLKPSHALKATKIEGCIKHGRDAMSVKFYAIGFAETSAEQFYSALRESSAACGFTSEVHWKAEGRR
jgi:hypothetical protein